MGEAIAEVPEGVYDKYRVIKVADIIDAGMDIQINAIAITEFVFVLRPDRDYHARVALTTYAMSVSAYNPALSKDLFDALELMDAPTNMEPD